MQGNSITIIGAGLAGLTAAIHLSKIGYRVTIIEKNNFPKHKVCGEYISNEVVPYLEWLGVNPNQLKPAVINKVALSTSTGKVIHGTLPLGGFGISRYTLDYFLYQKAVEEKCIFIHETVTNIDFFEDTFSITLSDEKIHSATIVIGAYGKRSAIDQKLNRHFIQKKSPWLAVKGHYSGDFADDLVGLHNFKGGYCGVSKVENGVINICYLTNYDSFKGYRDIETFQKEVVCRNPQLQEVFENTVPLFEKPLTISQISFDRKTPVEAHILMIGDTAGLIHPLCGNGMAMAIHSAKIVAELIDDFFRHKITSRIDLEKEYAKQWNKNFKNRLTMGNLLSRVLLNEKLSETILRLLIHFPSIVPRIIRQTHGKLIPVPQ